MSDPVDVETEGPVARITLQQPERLNVLTREVQEALIAAAESIAAAGDVRVVIVGGDGGTFSAGADLELLAALYEQDVDLALADLGRRMADAVASIPAVTIARVEGHCIGGGIVLAAVCDLRIAAEGTYFSIPEVDLGIPLGWGAIPRLVRVIGAARTLEIVGTGRAFGAEEAAAMGLVNRVVPQSELAATVDELAASLAAKPAYALSTITRTVRDAAETLAPALGRVSDAQLLAAAARDDESAAAARSYLERVRST